MILTREADRKLRLRQEAACRTGSCVYDRKLRLRTIFKDESDGGDGLAADQHDGIISGGLGEGLGLAVGVQDQPPALVQQLLVVQRDAGPTGEQLLEQRRPVDSRGTTPGQL